MSKNIVFEGWLTKSPPSKRIWRTKWRRRWFALRQSGELPGQYFLDYYADRNCRRLKGTINLDFCEQVDAGLHMERGSQGSLDPKLRGSVFTIQTQTRVYHLEADCEADMERWVNAICRVCGLRSTDEPERGIAIYENRSAREIQTDIALKTLNESRRRQAAQCVADYNAKKGKTPEMAHAATMTYERYGGAETGPYIPISECVTGPRAQENIHIAFNFDPKNIIISTRVPFEKKQPDYNKRVYLSQPQIRINDVELSEYESNLSEDECRSLNTGESDNHGWTVSKTFTKLSLTPHENKAVNTDGQTGPPVPPRPPKTFKYKDLSHKEMFQVHQQVPDNPQWLRVPHQSSRGGSPPSPGPSGTCRSVARTDDEDEAGQSIHYCNLTSSFINPPAVDRALKPRLANLQANVPVVTVSGAVDEEEKPKLGRLQYLDLDLPVSASPTDDAPIIVHGRSRSSDAYKTVDFVKTEALNSTTQDAEARNQL